MALIIGNNGSNTISGTGGDDLVFANGGNDTINAGSGNDVVFAGAGNDIVYGGSGIDLLYGESGNDTLNGGSGSDYVDGGAGADTLIFNATDLSCLDIYNGGSGIDRIIFEFTTAQWANTAIKADILALFSLTGCSSAIPIYLDSLNLCIINIEQFQVKVDGQIINPFAPTNTVPIAVNDAFSITENDALGASSSVIGNDATGTGAYTVALTSGPALGLLTLNANGTFAFDPGTSYDYLAAGESANAAFTYQITNSAGVSNLATVNITITGTNDTPTVSGVFTGAVIEDNSNAAIASGTITVTDVDTGQSGVVASVQEGTYGTLTLQANGSWTYELDNSRAATQALAAGVVVSDTFNVAAIDGTALGAIAITVTGTDDAPTANGDFTGAVIEDDSNAAIATGTITVTDVDANAGQSGVIASVIEGIYGTLTLQADGNWNYVLDNSRAATQALSAGVVGTESFGVTEIDGTALAPIQVTVTGTNDGPSAANPVGLVSSGPNFATINFNFTDVDLLDTGHTAVVEYIDASGAVAGLLLDEAALNDFMSVLSVSKASGAADGSLLLNVSFNLSDFAYLGAGESVTLNYSLTVDDGDGGTSVRTLPLVVTGTNDAPTVSGVFTGAVIEDDSNAAIASGTITVSDADTGQSGVVASVIEGTYGTLALQANGSWVYTLDNSRAATQALAAGVVATETFAASAIDGTALAPIEISVTGTNDAATAAGVFTGATTEDDSNAAIASGTITVSDADTGQSGVVASVIEGTYGRLNLQANGAWVYTLNNGLVELSEFGIPLPSVAPAPGEPGYATQALGAGVIATDIFNVTSIDGTVLAPIEISVTGINDAASASGVFTGATVEDDSNAAIASGIITVADIDTGQSGVVASVQEGTYGTLNLQANGSWTYQLDNSRAATQALAAGVVATEIFAATAIDGTTLSPIEISITGTNDAATATGVFTGTTIEDDSSAASVSGTITVSDVDTGQSGVIASVQNGTYGLLNLQANGTWVYWLNNGGIPLPSADPLPVVFPPTNTGAATQALAAGELATEIFYFTSQDQTILDPLVIQVVGANDGPSVAAIAQTNLTETTNTNAIAATINVNFTDIDLADIGHTATVVSTGATGVIGGLSLDAAALSGLITVESITKAAGSTTGSATLTFNAASTAFDYLRANETVTLNYAITVDDGDGGTAMRSFVFTVKGTNDVATATGVFTGEVVEGLSGTTTNVSGVISVTDRDFGQSSIVGSTKNGTYGTLVTQTNGAWVYTLSNNFATQALAAGEIASDTFSVTALDGTVLSPIVISVAGTNDAPSAASNANAIIQETTNSSPITGTLNINFTDTDKLDIGHTATVVSLGASVTVTGLTLDAAALESLITVTSVTKAAGATSGVASLAFTAQSTQFDYLKAGQSVNLNYNIIIDDGDGGQSTRGFFVRVTGTNDVPTFSGLFTGATTEDTSTASSASGVITVTDADFGQSGIAAGTRSGTYGTLVTQANGAWVYTLNNTRLDTQSLTAGVVATETFTLTTIDGTALTPIVISVSGTNDAPTPVSNEDGNANAITQETTNSSPITGTINVNFIDVDLLDMGYTATFVSIGVSGGAAAGLSLNAAALESLITVSSVTKATGSIEGVASLAFSAQSTDFDYLKAGQFVNLNYNITIDDGDGGTHTQVFFVRVTGTNDVPTATGVFTGATIEDTSGAASASGIITVTDVESGESGVIASSQNGTYGALALQANGAWVYTLNNTLATTQSLGAGVVVTESFAVTSIDGTALAPIEITVTGTNDSPTVTGNFGGLISYLNPGYVETGAFVIQDRDAFESAAVSDTIVGAWGTFAIESDGDWTYTRNGDAFDFVTDSFINGGGLNGLRYIESFTAFTVDGRPLEIDILAAPDALLV